MYVDPSKPLPIPSEKKDYLGSVLDAMLNLHFSRLEHQGAADDTFQQKVNQVTATANAKLDKFASDVDLLLKTHTDKKGAVHGETAESVGLGNKDNWRMGTVAEHITGTNKTVYAHPQGLKALVEDRLVVDPTKYIGSRIIPIASAGQLGTVPQWAFNWKDGEVTQSFTDPMDFFTDTPWQFKSDSGVYILPSMNGSDVLTQVTADPGRSKRAKTPFGGTNVRIYNKALDVRRARPASLRAESSIEPNAELIKGSAHLFDKHSAFYVENEVVGVRGFNRYRLPFDTLTNQGKWSTNWSGIVESRERFLYNLRSSVEYTNLGGNGQDLYFILRLGIYTFSENGLDMTAGPGRVAETTAAVADIYDTLSFSLPTGNKVKALTENGKVTGIYMKLRDIVSYTDAQLADLVTVFNSTLASKLAFTWRNRLKGDMAIRIPLGFYSKDKKFYTNYYLDLSLVVKEDTANKAAAITVTTLRDLTANIQSLNDNLQTATAGRFTQYAGNAKGNVFHPTVFNGAFDSLGGHIKTFTLYNRQYIGYYQHNVKSVADWLLKGDVTTPTLTKYQYAQNATLNQDGMYGDHLRHIPLTVKGTTIDYLTYSRDWRNQYRWAVVNVDVDPTAEMVTGTGNSHYGPWRNSVAWLDPLNTTIPSFVVSNDADSTSIDVNCLVFNNQNNFQGYGRFGYDVSNKDVPLTWLDPTTLDTTILNWVANNGGGWIRNQRQFFYFKGVIYWFSQTLDNKERKADGTDCYYGYIKNAYIDVQGTTRTIKINGDITLDVTATAKPLVVNTVSSLNVDNKNITGWDEYLATDVYIMLMSAVGNDNRYQLMVNLGPFNNFYFEFETVINQTAGTVTFAPNTQTLNPVFPITDNSFAVDYDTLTQYGKTPHQFHPNFQTPVMLKKSMWSFRKTPGQYGLFTKSGGTVIVEGGLMDAVAGIPLFPVGSVMTAGGSNVLAKSPVSVKAADYPGKDELFVKLNETPSLSAAVASDGAVVYGVNRNPAGYDLEPNSGIIPCGFIKEGIYYHYDPDGFRNDLLPVVDGKRMNFYGYGSSFPALLGVYGSGTPINRFFLTSKPTIMSWLTGSGRVVPIGSGTNVTITVNGVAQPYTGSGTFTIPTTYTGTVELAITGMKTVKWAAGLANLKQIGISVTALDFSNAAGFVIGATLPKRITSLKGLFQNAVGTSWSGLELWDTSNVTDMSGMCQGSATFNHDLSKWNTTSVTTMERMFQGASAFNRLIGPWNTSAVTTMKAMFLNASSFNADIGTWNVIRVANFASMFEGASAFNKNIANWNVTSGSDFSRMFYNASAFNIDIGKWNMAGAVTTESMFALTPLFNGNIANWDVSGVENMAGMFQGSGAFDRAIGSWDVGRVKTFTDMFNASLAFGADGDVDLSDWNVSRGINFSRMFMGAVFNSPIDNWAPGPNADLTSMFESAVNFNQEISSWDVSQVSKANRMFANTTANQVDMTGLTWTTCASFVEMFLNTTFNGDVSDWTFRTTVGISMQAMFSGATFFTGEGIDTWDVGKVTNFMDMFFGAKAFNADVTGWDVSYGTNFRNMFRVAQTFNQPIGVWDMGMAVDISDMFREAQAFNQPLNDWNTINVEQMHGTFVFASAFNQPLDKWKTGKVLSFVAMFGSDNTPTNLGISVFNQDIGMWDTSKATSLDTMFNYNTVFNQDLSGWVVTQKPTHSAFDDGATAWTKPRPNFLD